MCPFLLMGCNKKKVDPVIPDSFINVDVNEIVLQEEDTYQVDVEVLKEGTIVFYSSSNSDVVSVSDDGLITANSVGEAYVTIRGGRDSFSIGVSVTSYQAKDTLQIELSQDNFNLSFTDIYNLPMAIKYGSEVINNATITYQVENESVCRVVNGAIYATGRGTSRVIINASYNGSEASKLITVNVY